MHWPLGILQMLQATCCLVDVPSNTLWKLRFPWHRNCACARRLRRHGRRRNPQQIKEACTPHPTQFANCSPKSGGCCGGVLDPVRCVDVYPPTHPSQKLGTYPHLKPLKVWQGGNNHVWGEPLCMGDNSDVTTGKQGLDTSPRLEDHCMTIPLIDHFCRCFTTFLNNTPGHNGKYKAAWRPGCKGNAFPPPNRGRGVVICRLFDLASGSQTARRKNALECTLQIYTLRLPRNCVGPRRGFCYYLEPNYLPT